ncbi:helix-turn-helix domain-containing protein [Parvibaculum sp.]|uniref:helix-turn-helix domain-containing protein n=1 Tax=Parvibaculum sp. TaxID=2024848 RepID=UPI001B18F6B7|nr:helix-turn-helix domain-containing protein [Parvibaculum sp.]MBO6668408.1 helix-turn-helix transcriptional regulator [Parvibaculum sp.]MBO6691345.1 helix-turn-helix transcriptional regulator [Parvibaculum sp.]MBO6715343.1 helix-turn-helix transcriptional regulator [Parvibaculum sp.]
MTPFGRKVRELRAARGLTMKEMAAALRVTPAYLSALEHGKRGRPSWRLVQTIIGYFNVIWDEAEELERLARISHPRIAIDTSGLAPQATELANRLAEEISELNKAEIAEMLALLDRRKKKREG